MNDTTEPLTIDQAVDAYMAEDDAPAPETTEGDESEVSDTDEAEAEASDQDTTDTDAGEEAEPDEADADEAEESDEDEAEDDEDDEPQMFTVTVDGTEQSVDLAELRRGYSGQAKIQKDLTANASTRKQLEQAARAMMDQQAEILQLHQQAQQGGFKAPPQAPDHNLIETNPTEYMRQRARYETAIGEYQGEQAQLSKIHQQRLAYQQHQQAQNIAAQFEVLKTRIPEMADEKAGPEYARKLLKAGSDYGFSGDELGGIDDPRALEVLRDAMNWRNLKNGQAASKKPPQPSRNVKSKAARKPAPDAKAKAVNARFKKTGSIHDAVDAFMAESS